MSQTKERILNAAEATFRRRLERQGKIGGPSEAGNYLRVHCGHRPSRVFGCIFLDAQYQILVIEDLFFGTIGQAAVHLRQVVRRALALNAAAIIAFHNHPCGNLIPSRPTGASQSSS